MSMEEEFNRKSAPLNGQDFRGIEENQDSKGVEILKCGRVMHEDSTIVWPCIAYIPHFLEFKEVFSQRRGQWKAATQSQEFFRTLQRYYSNAYKDAEKQNAINVTTLQSQEYRRSWSDGNILRESGMPASTPDINKGFPSANFSNDSGGSKMLSESTPEMSTPTSELAYSSRTNAILVQVEVFRFRSIESTKTSIVPPKAVTPIPHFQYLLAFPLSKHLHSLIAPLVTHLQYLYLPLPAIQPPAIVTISPFLVAVSPWFSPFQGCYD
ncbi:Phosphoinositide phosphatase SAC4 [Sesamum angolense]|uniref:Phosphoinositide phosphatase SAC4 n=1 Tax=Sesamum angolense TaxID=2727404 RepID=A0AAE1WD09_9LAMI|nr:Phosphoinositide phosphatase SAC4 [Sesamum angolense]